MLNHIEQKFPHDDLPLQELDKKLITLLALITGHRLQTLSLIKVENIYFESEGVQILFTDNIKTTRPKHEQPCPQIPFFEGNPKLCEESILLTYIEKTANMRNNGQEYFGLYQATNNIRIFQNRHPCEMSKRYSY